MFGEIELTTGIGLFSVTGTVAETEGSAALVVVTFTRFGLGSEAGAVYTPAALIVPSVAFPPTTPFTDHLVTELLVP
jgi:hypothetical protein